MELKSNERGNIYILAVFLIPCILAILALFLDGGIGYIARQQYDGAATEAALGALEAYVNSTQVANVDKLNEARVRAESLLSVAIGTNAITRNRVDSGAHALKFVWEVGGGENGFIRHGIWHFAEPTGAGAYTGCGTGAAFRPCFELLTDQTKSGNAIQVEPFLAGGSLIKTVFARTGIMSANSTTVGTRKGAALIPRLMYFLPDVSLSSVLYSHLSRVHSHGTAATTFAGYYAFPLESGNSCAGAMDASKVFVGLRDTFQDLQSNHTTRPAGEYSAAYANNFYMSDYTCVEVASGQSECDYAKFYIDTFPHRTPQPLAAILAGMHTSLIKMRQRGTLSDRVGMLGFDSGATMSCRGSLAPPAPGGSLGLLNVKNSVDYNRLLDATDLSISTSDSRRVNRMLYPRFVNANGYGVKTDIGLGLRTAEQLVTSNYDIDAAAAAQLDIIVYSDGETNCYRTSHVGSCPAAFTSGADPITGDARCCKSSGTGTTGGVPNPLIWSVDEILEQFDSPTDPLIVRRAALNMVLFSNAVHKVVRSKGGSGGCMSDAEITAAGQNMTDWSGWEQDPMDATRKRYWYVNKLWQAVDKSGGFWWVVRPPCSSASDPAGGGSPVNYHAAVTAACNNVNTANAVVDLNAQLASSGYTCQPCSGNTCPYTPGVDPEICRYVDASGRLMCDLDNRDQSQQVILFINEMTKINPFKPVQM